MASRDLIGPKLHKLLECAVDALDYDPPARAFLATGEIAWDDCCDGQVWVRLIGAAPLSGSARTVAARMPCGVLGWVYDVGVGVLRCAQTVDDNGHAPTAQDLTAETDGTTRDMAALSSAVLCCDTVEVRSVERWTPLGPDGGCVGGEWAITLATDVCRCP